MTNLCNYCYNSFPVESLHYFPTGEKKKHASFCMFISLCWNPQLSDAVTECKDLEALTKEPSYARVILSEIPVLRHRIGKMQLFLCFLKKISHFCSTWYKALDMVQPNPKSAVVNCTVYETSGIEGSEFQPLGWKAKMKLSDARNLVV